MSIFIVAEVGINHNGDMSICKDLIDLACDTGCDAVKFQKRDIDLVYTQEFLNKYRESPWGTTQREQKQGLEFGFAEFSKLTPTVKVRISSGLHPRGISIVSIFCVSLIVNIIK